MSVHPVPITIFSLTRLVPRVGLPGQPCIDWYSAFDTICAKTFQGLGPLRPKSCDENRVYYISLRKSTCSANGLNNLLHETPML